MTKIPYDYMEERAHKLSELCAMLHSTIVVSDLLDELNDYLNACGWTKEEFDNETLNRINADWEPLTN